MSAVLGSSTKPVYVRLLNEGTTVYRPVEVVTVDGGAVKLIAPPGFDSEDEAWEFKPGSIVLLKEQILEGKEALVAYALRDRANS